MSEKCKKISTVLICAVAIFAFFFWEVGVGTEQLPPETLPDDLMNQADDAFAKMHLLQAQVLYHQAEDMFYAKGDLNKTQIARTARLNSKLILDDYRYNRTQAFDTLVPMLNDGNVSSLGISNTTFNEFLSDPSTETIEIDNGEIRYADTLDNIFNRNLTILRQYYTKIHYNPLIEDPARFVFSRSDLNDLPATENIRYEGLATLNISRDLLPDNGTIRVWIPTPIETESQTNVTVTISPEKWVVQQPDTRADLGMGYLEIPVTELDDDLVINSSFTFISHERRDQVDPDLVEQYNLSDPEYQRYIASGSTIQITSEISSLARDIIGDEQNPYLQAHEIYRYIVENISYSYVPHQTLEILHIPESVYAFKNGYGDCGTQSDLFAALCRSLGIPARTTGGMHIFNDKAGYHVWAEVMIPGYGWIPVDSSIGQSALQWGNVTHAQQAQYNDYFFGNQDPFRYYIQNDEDVTVVPDPGNIPYCHAFQQFPIVDGNTSMTSMDYYQNWTVNIRRVE